MIHQLFSKASSEMNLVEIWLSRTHKELKQTEKAKVCQIPEEGSLKNQ